ncbi:MAG: transcriptional repressor [Chromatiales bacterium]|nr:transcriptional repressor [Chromatiales bacterium]
MTDAKNQKRSVIRLLRSHGITPTSQRVKIAAALFEKPQHLTADQVMLMVNQDRKKVSKATIYNTLGLFAEKGLLKELTVDANRAYYDSTTHNHHHFFNQETQEMSDIAADDIEIKLPEQLPEGTEIERVEMVVYLRNKD